jgi:hypothetical protein
MGDPIGGAVIDRPGGDVAMGKGRSLEPSEPDVRRRGAVFWAGAVVGWAVIGWGLRGVFHHHIDTQPQRLARFFVRGALLHDLVLAPVVLGVGLVVVRVTPARWRSGIQAALIVSGCLALFSYPEVRGYAHILHNPTSLPYNYAANLAIAVGAVVAVMVAVVAVRRTRARTSAPPVASSPEGGGSAGAGAGVEA